MGYTYVITGILMIFIEIIIKRFPNMIVGYYILSQEDKKKIDIQRLSSLTRNLFVIIGLILIVGDLITRIGFKYFSSCLYVVIPIAVIIYAYQAHKCNIK